MPDIDKKIEQMLTKHSEIQILRAIVNSYAAIGEMKPGKNGKTVFSITAPVESTTTTINLDPEPAKPEPVKFNELPPCPTCGGIDFLRTGTCSVCITCGSSQGCS